MIWRFLKVLAMAIFAMAVVMGGLLAAIYASAAFLAWELWIPETGEALLIGRVWLFGSVFLGTMFTFNEEIRREWMR